VGRVERCDGRGRGLSRGFAGWRRANDGWLTTRAREGVGLATEREATAAGVAMSAR
jgi:hypothetical protein